MRFSYPVALDLSDVTVLVVGGGAVAARKAAGLAAAGAVVRVVAPDVSPAMEALSADGSVAELRRRRWHADDLDGARLVVTATDDPAVGAAVAAAASAANLWVNVADEPAHCTFVLPAIARRDPLTITVGTDGASPALAQRLRDRAGALLSDDVVALADELAAERAELHAAGESTEHVDWTPRLDAVLPL